MAAWIGRLRARHEPARLLRFAVVGTMTALVYAGLLSIGIYALEVSTLLAASAAFVLAVLINYALHKWWTFANTEAHSATGPRYVAMILGGLAINSTVLYVATDLWHLGLWGPQLVSIAAMVAYNYVFLSQIVFRGEEAER